MHSTILCVIALVELFPPGASKGYIDKMESTYVERLGTCIEISNRAEEMGVQKSLAVSIGFEESRFDASAVSSKNARGPLQVLPKYGCPKIKVADCDLIGAALKILKEWIGQSKTLMVALCRYNAGYRGCKSKKARKYARSILRRRHRLRAMTNNVSYDFNSDD